MEARKALSSGGCACARKPISAAAGKPGTKREAGDDAAAAAAAADEDDSTTAPNKRSKARQAEDADMTDAGLQAAAAAAAAAGAGERPHYTDEHTVFVKGLGFDVQEEDLRRLFAELGVKGVRMGRDRVTGASRVTLETDQVFAQ
jgi:hypothetical protein